MQSEASCVEPHVPPLHPKYIETTADVYQPDSTTTPIEAERTISSLVHMCALAEFPQAARASHWNLVPA